MDTPWNLYIPLSLVMFFEYAVWGAWAPVLAARLLGPLKMSGKQTGWIYATLPLACIVSPLVGGQLADKYFNTEYILAGAHAVAAILMFLAVRQKTFPGLFVVMLGWSLCYAATMPLVNSVLFKYVTDGACQGRVFIWAPVAWALVGYALSGWRMTRPTQGDGSDALVFSAVLGLAMAGCCLVLPHTPPAQANDVVAAVKADTKDGAEAAAKAPLQADETPLVKAFSTLKNPDFLVFIIASMCVAGTMQFYFLGSGQYMIDRGISGKAVPGAMAMAQAAQAVATWFLLGPMLKDLGSKWTLAIGAASWLALYIIYLVSAPRVVLFLAQPLHGLAYVLFIIVGQIYAGSVAPKGAEASMQALIFAATTGVGLFVFTQLAGFAMDKFSVEGKFQWPKIWAIPLGVVLVGTLVFAFVFQGKPPAAEVAKPAAAAQQQK